MSSEPAASLTHAARTQIFEALRLGTVPDHGLDAIADLDADVDDAINRFLGAVSDAGGALRMLRGDLGTGKTFSLKLAAQRARSMGFVTTIAVLNEQTLTLHQADRVYRAWMSGLRSEGATGGALLDVVDRWIFRVDALLRVENDERPTVPGEALLTALEHDLMRRAIGGQLSEFRTALMALARARLAGDTETSWGLVSWLGGSDNVGANVLRAAGIRGRLTADDVDNALLDVTRLIDAAGFAGVLFGIDELAAILRSEREQREKSWEQLLRIADQWRLWPRTAWLFSATHEVFDSPRGIVGFEPLHQRVSVVSVDGVSSARQVQIPLSTMDGDRLIRIARRLVALYPSTNPDRITALTDDAALQNVLDKISTTPGAPVQPRRFLRAMCDVLDSIDSGRITDMSRFVPSPVIDDGPEPLPTASVRF